MQHDLSSLHWRLDFPSAREVDEAVEGEMEAGLDKEERLGEGNEIEMGESDDEADNSGLSDKEQHSYASVANGSEPTNL